MMTVLTVPVPEPKIDGNFHSYLIESDCLPDIELDSLSTPPNQEHKTQPTKSAPRRRMGIGAIPNGFVPMRKSSSSGEVLHGRNISVQNEFIPVRRTSSSNEVVPARKVPIPNEVVPARKVPIPNGVLPMHMWRQSSCSEIVPSRKISQTRSEFMSARKISLHCANGTEPSKRISANSQNFAARKISALNGVEPLRRISTASDILSGTRFRPHVGMMSSVSMASIRPVEGRHSTCHMSHQLDLAALTLG